MQFDAIESRRLGAARSVGKNPRQYLRQLAHVCEVRIRHTLAITETQRLKLALAENVIDDLVRSVLEKHTHVRFGGIQPTSISSRFRQRATVTLDQLKKAFEVFRLFRPALHGKEVNDLDEQ